MRQQQQAVAKQREMYYKLLCCTDRAVSDFSGTYNCMYYGYALHGHASEHLDTDDEYPLFWPRQYTTLRPRRAPEGCYTHVCTLPTR